MLPSTVQSVQHDKSFPRLGNASAMERPSTRTRHRQRALTRRAIAHISTGTTYTIKTIKTTILLYCTVPYCRSAERQKLHSSRLSYAEFDNSPIRSTPPPPPADGRDTSDARKHLTRQARSYGRSAILSCVGPIAMSAPRQPHRPIKNNLPGVCVPEHRRRLPKVRNK